MMRFINLLLLVLSISKSVSGQFKCTLNASDEDTCLKTVGDDDAHCAWCSLGGFAFCMSEQAAEAMEQTLHAECERFGDNDDDDSKKSDDDRVVPPGADDVFPSTDDQAAADDDKHKPKSDDDAVTPTDDNVPDNFWTCLQEKDQTKCDNQGCVWCTAKSAGFSLCMAGPAAEQAEGSDFFECDNKNIADETVIFAVDRLATSLTDTASDPFDATCVKAFLEEQTEEACTSTSDQDGDYCKWCSLAGMTNLCLTPEQADKGQALGITCLDFDASLVARGESEQAIPALSAPLYDTACMMALLQDHSASGCASAVDSDGSPCEYCPILQGSLDLCLTSDQVSLLEQSGVSCEASEVEMLHDDPYDTSCIVSSLSGANKDACISTMDDGGKACRYCSVGGVASICLTDAQAELAGGYGLECDENTAAGQLQDNPYDASCIMAYLQDQSEESCVSALDEDGDACQYCTLQGAVNLCLTPSQADIAGGLGVECNGRSVDAAAMAQDTPLEANDIFDMTCVKAYLNDQSKDFCRSTMDGDGAVCKWCHTPQSGDICFTETQGDIASQIGMWCDDDEMTAPDNSQVDIPDDFWTCLQNFDETGCSSSCTWCDTSVGMGFCLSTPVAQSTKECTFFDCNFKGEETVEANELVVASSDLYDPTCLGAGMGSDDAESVCNSTMDSSGSRCVWCNVAGVFGVCVSDDQASMMGDYLQCNSATPLIAVA
ncbi:hypothetical protein MPSEU_000993500 [Mayamaea pseudoterrestris]|nr:hypothetical protein MPSEU_000993500 [Mayamaea pseudoterrestris]